MARVRLVEFAERVFGQEGEQLIFKIAQAWIVTRWRNKQYGNSRIHIFEGRGLIHCAIWLEPTEVQRGSGKNWVNALGAFIIAKPCFFIALSLGN
jgi:hypothetical protein